MNIPISYNNQLLATKFFVPTSSHVLISRSHLIDLLNGSLQLPFTLVSAPAGFGKTTLLANWIRSLPEDDVYVAWVSLDEGDNDLVRFWTYLLSALENQQQGLCTDLLVALRDSQPSSIQNILQTFINALVNCSKQTLLILDDYHLITDKTIHTSLRYLIENLPPQLHLIVATRVDPPLPLIRWQARSRMQVIRAEQLRCTEQEVRNFLREVMDIELGEASVKMVTEKTEGWLVGLQLLGLSIQGRTDAGDLLEELSGRQHYIVDYLTEEVLNRQSSEILAFLLQTSILPQLTASLCDFVLQRSDSQQVLLQLEHANLFIVSLDTQRRWYRYHALFAEALHYRLKQSNEETIVALHHRASLWYADQNSLVEAILHAFLAQEWEWAADLIERIPFSIIWGAEEQEMVILHHWLEQLPEEVICARPRLCLACANIMRTIVPFSVLENWLDAAETTLMEALHHSSLTAEVRKERENLLGEVIAFRAFLLAEQEDGQTVIGYCERALSLLAPENMIQRAQVFFAQAMAYSFSPLNDVDRAIENGLQAGEYAQAAGKRAIATFYMGRTGCYLIVAGRLREAYELVQKAIQVGKDSRGIALSTVSGPMTFLADILREWNHLDEALDLAKQAISLGRRSGSLALLLHGYTVLGRIYLSRGELGLAQTALQQFEMLGRKTNPHLYIHARSFSTTIDRVRLWIARGELGRAVGWATQFPMHEWSGTQFALERDEVARARVLLAQREPAQALERLEPVLLRATNGKRRNHVIEIHLLQALAHQQLGREHEALEALSQAVQLGESEGYIRRFVDEGPLMASLLTKLRNQRYRQDACTYLDQMIEAFPDEMHMQQEQQLEIQAVVQPLIEPLSEREQEVLSLLAWGYSNHDIASRLVLAISTVKGYVSSIITKLGTTNRTQAVRRARELGLLQEE